MEWASKDKSYSERRACSLVGIDPRVYRYRTTRPDDTVIRRRLHILLAREGFQINWKKVYRLYREERLTVRKRGGGKRALGTRSPMTIPQGANQRWSLDFASDALLDSRRFRIGRHLDRSVYRLIADVTLPVGGRIARANHQVAAGRGDRDIVLGIGGSGVGPRRPGVLLRLR